MQHHQSISNTPATITVHWYDCQIYLAKCSMPMLMMMAISLSLPSPHPPAPGGHSWGPRRSHSPSIHPSIHGPGHDAMNEILSTILVTFFPPTTAGSWQGREEIKGMSPMRVWNDYVFTLGLRLGIESSRQMWFINEWWGCSAHFCSQF